MNKHYDRKNLNRWHCTTKVLDHPYNAKMITLGNGKQSLYYQGQTFFMHYKTQTQTRWSCTHLPKCKAYLYANEKLVVSKFCNQHSHEPKKFIISKGIYIKMS